MTKVSGRDRGILDAKGFRRLAGSVILANLLRLIAATSRTVYEPANTLERLRELSPLIICCWHGQGFLSFTTMHGENRRAHLLISRHPDGQIVAGAAKSLGFKLIEGSGANFKEPTGTGGLAALRQLIRALKAGENVALSADIPPIPGRQVSDSLALLARMSGRPVVPFNISTSRRTVLESQWDKMQIAYPFSRIAVVMGEPVWVPDTADDLSPYSKRIGEALDRSLARAFEIADGDPLRS